MGKKILAVFLTLFLIFGSFTIPVTAESSQPQKSLSKAEAIGKLNTLSGGKLKFQESDGQIFLSGKLSDKKAPGSKSSSEFLDENKSIFGINDTAKELKVTAVKKEQNGSTFVKYAQLINGLEVYGDTLTVRYDKSGIIRSVYGSIQENKTVTVLGNLSLSQDAAVKAAERQFTYRSLRNTPTADKMIYTKADRNYEVYKVNISYTEPQIENYDVYVEAHSGKIIDKESNLRYDGPVTGSGVDVSGNTVPLNLYLQASTYYMYDNTKSALTDGIRTYDMKHGTSTSSLVSGSSSTFSDENSKASVSAHYNAGKVIDFYKNLFNRNSLDNSGMAIHSFTHYDVDYNNAFWDGAEMIYGDGDGVEFTYFSGDLDVVGHEMTHGVISNTADLFYANQPGALNESLADTFGVLIETYSKDGVADGGNWAFNAADWVVGDDIYTPGISGDALRSMSNPALYGQPDNMSNYQYMPDDEYGDYGGVHTNSGIPNKAAYLIAQSIGMEKTARIYYDALVNYMGVYTDFAEAESYLEDAATDLYPTTPSVETAVADAFTSVGVGAAATVNDPYEPNDSLLTAYAVNCGSTYQSYISSGSDLDYYKFTADFSGKVNINLSDLPTDYDLYLCDADGNTLDYSANSSTEDESITYDVTSGTTYYIEVVGFALSYNPLSEYSLSLTKAVTGITLNKTTVGLKVGESAALTATVSPPDAFDTSVIWSSDNTSVATVDSTGTVNAKGLGATTITAETADGGYTASCNVIVYQLPTVPAGAQAASAGYNSIKVSWAAVPGASGYEIYRSDSSGGVYVKVGNVSAASFTNTGLTFDKSYYYKVRAYTTVWSDVYYSAYSSVVGAKPALSAPAGPQAASAGYNSIRVGWNAVAGANGYEVYRSASSGGTYAKAGETTALYYTNTGLATNTTYYYKVRAYRLVGSARVYGGYSSIVSSKPVPSVPGSVGASSASYNSTKITWAGVSGATAYQIYRSTSSTGTFSLFATTASLSYVNTGLATGTTYFYKVRAYRVVGSAAVCGSFSAPVSARPVPATPSGSKAASSAYNSIKTSWNPVSGANGYQVYRATSINGTYAWVVTTVYTNYNNTGLTTGSTYYYKVRAFRYVGSVRVYGSFGPAVSAKPVPATPTSVKAVRSAYNSIKTSWGPVSGASGYQVYRATSINGTYAWVVTTAYTNYNNTRLATGRTYYYKVRAYRMVDATRVYGAFSAVVRATT